MARRRVSDRGRLAALWGRVGRDLVTVVAVGLAVYSVGVTQSNVDDIQHTTHNVSRLAAANTATLARLQTEQKERINETCRIQETKQKSDVEALRQTYLYLGGLTGKELAEPLNRTIIATLPRTIREAQVDDAPGYCDKPNVGLPEPDPPLPCGTKGAKANCLRPPKNLPPR